MGKPPENSRAAEAGNRAGKLSGILRAALQRIAAAERPTRSAEVIPPRSAETKSLISRFLVESSPFQGDAARKSARSPVARSPIQHRAQFTAQPTLFAFNYRLPSHHLKNEGTAEKIMDCLFLKNVQIYSHPITVQFAIFLELPFERCRFFHTRTFCSDIV